MTVQVPKLGSRWQRSEEIRTVDAVSPGIMGPEISYSVPVVPRWRWSAWPYWEAWASEAKELPHEQSGEPAQ